MDSMHIETQAYVKQIATFCEARHHKEKKCVFLKIKALSKFIYHFIQLFNIRFLYSKYSDVGL